MIRSNPPQYYRLRAPHRYSDSSTTAVTVREGGATDIYLSVGAGNNRMGITREDAWALWRCLGAALHGSPDDNTPPDWLTDPAVST